MLSLRLFLPCLFCLLLAAQPRAADAPPPAELDALIAAIPAAQLEQLHTADFMTVRDLTANLPHGSLTIQRGVIASYKGHDRHTAGIVIGEIEMLLDRMPADGYIGFPQEALDADGALRVALTQSFLYASVSSEAYLKEVGFVAALRKWDALKPAEQRQFLEVLALAWPGIWRDPANESALRLPQGGEVYGAAWVQDWPGSAPGSLTRIDMWVEADGRTTRGIEHATGKLLAEYPVSDVRKPLATAAGEHP